MGEANALRLVSSGGAEQGGGCIVSGWAGGGGNMRGAAGAAGIVPGNVRKREEKVKKGCFHREAFGLDINYYPGGLASYFSRR